MLTLAMSPNRPARGARNRAWSVLAGFALVSAAVVAPVSTAAAVSPDVVFADAGLKTCVADQLGLDPNGSITEADMALLTSLSCQGAAIADITPLSHATNLTWLELLYDSITDVTPLATLTNLTHLYLAGNSVTDITPLATLTNLTDLDLGGNSVTDVTPLATLTSLAYLDLDGNSITDVTPLATLTSLTYLDLGGNSVTDVTPLATLTNLTSLYLYSNSVTDVTPLATLTSLTDLDLHGNSITDVTPLATLTNLVYLYVHYNAISDASPLSTLTNLVEVFLTYQSVSLPGATTCAPFALPVVKDRAGSVVPVTPSAGGTVASNSVSWSTVGSKTLSWASANGEFTGTMTHTVVLCHLTATPTPNITGTKRVGYTLATGVGTWSPATVTLTFQWKRAGVAIPGATGKYYKLVTADAGKAITVAVTGSKTGYVPVIKTSAAVTIEKLLTATPIPTITGTKRVGYTQTANPGTWSPAVVTLTYQWRRAGVPIVGAIAKTYRLTTTDVGKLITVTVTGSKTGYTPVAKTSAAVTIEKLLTATPTPTITGTTRVGYTLATGVGTWSPAVVTLKFQWKRAGVAIPGGTAKYYKPVTADVGKLITVTVTGSKTGYTTVAKTSAAVKPTL